MELPFYYSFKEFEENYNTDLENWLKIYPDADEYNFLEEIKLLYYNFVMGDFDGFIFDNGIFVTGTTPDDVMFEENINITSYTRLLKEQIERYLEEDIKDLLDVDTEDLDYSGFWDVCQTKGLYFDTQKHKLLKPLFEFDCETKLKLNEIKYKNFSFSVVRIAEWIRGKSLSLQNKKTATIEIPIKETDEPQPEKFTVPEIIKILDKLNIKGMMGEKGYTDFQTVQLLSDIFGRTEKSIRNNFDNKNHSETAERYISDLKNLKAKR